MQFFHAHSLVFYFIAFIFFVQDILTMELVLKLLLIAFCGFFVLKPDFITFMKAVALEFGKLL